MQKMGGTTCEHCGTIVNENYFFFRYGKQRKLDFCTRECLESEAVDQHWDGRIFNVRSFSYIRRLFPMWADIKVIQAPPSLIHELREISRTNKTLQKEIDVMKAADKLREDYNRSMHSFLYGFLDWWRK